MAKHDASDRDKLAAYRAKREAGATPEPMGATATSFDQHAKRPGLFVVQKHSARALHYDLRIELGGVLVSWALPKGPSLDPADKRMAIATEDHPLEYGDFEGIIPEGSYGAGAMIVWDRGLCVPHLDHAEGLQSGKLLFELKGYKLRGLWTLVRTKRGEGKQWLLIKKPDAFAAGEDAPELPPGSVLSGLTLEELAGGSQKAVQTLQSLAAAGAPRAVVDPRALPLMLAERTPAPFSREGWIFEIKYDGFRMLAAKTGDQGKGTEPILLSRNRLDLTPAFPEIARALGALPYPSLLFDGEITVLDDDARPSFSRLQKRARLSRRAEVERAAIASPAVLFVFDLLAFGEHDLRSLPLLERKEHLRHLLPAAGPIHYADHIAERGEDFHQGVRKLGLEGAMAKRADSPYVGGRSGHWLKLRAEHQGDFVVAGFRRAAGARSGVRSLLLAVLAGHRLTYAGSVASGLDRGLAREIEERATLRSQSEPPCADAPLPSAEIHWLRPELVVEVRYLEYTKKGHLRHPVLLGPRPDKEAGECFRADLPPDPTALAAESRQRPKPPAEPPLTRLDKIFWPAANPRDPGLTKGDLLAYYRAIAPWILPYLRDRPVVLDRYPDGITGKNFFQKHAPDYAPEWLRSEAIWSQDREEQEEPTTQAKKDARVFVADDLASLLYLINLGSIPLHLWASRCRSPQHPDWASLDLDAKDAPFAQVITVAQAIRALCSELGLPAFPKTSGATGLHVLLPLGGRHTHQQARQLAQVLAIVLAQELPEIASVARSPAERQGKVYIDFLQNGYGKLLVAPFSARPRPGATVSMPLTWDEVRPELDPASFTITNAPDRLRDLGRDPIAPLLSQHADLSQALARLARRLE